MNNLSNFLENNIKKKTDKAFITEKINSYGFKWIKEQKEGDLLLQTFKSNPIKFNNSTLHDELAFFVTFIIEVSYIKEVFNRATVTLYSPTYFNAIGIIEYDTKYDLCQQLKPNNLI